jgi:hypothetical protein
MSPPLPRRLAQNAKGEKTSADVFRLLYQSQNLEKPPLQDRVMYGRSTAAPHVRTIVVS